MSNWAFPQFPDDVLEEVRRRFDVCSYAASRLLSSFPETRETSLDEQLLRSLPPMHEGEWSKTTSGWALTIEASSTSSGRHYEEAEIADIAILVHLRIDSRRVLVKLAALQAKKLFAIERVAAGSAPRGGFQSPATPYQDLEAPIGFDFVDSSEYQSLKGMSRQVKSIDAFGSILKIPVYYLLYNPLTLPLHVDVTTREESLPTIANADVCCRILPTTDMHAVLNQSGRRIARYSDAQLAARRSCDREATKGGKSLSSFVTDIILGCKGGAKDPNDNDKCPWGYLFGINEDRRTGKLRFRSLINIRIESPRN